MAQTCANCSNEAHYLHDDPGANAVPYCVLCLPEHLRARADAGQFALPEDKPARKTRSDDVPDPDAGT